MKSNATLFDEIVLIGPITTGKTTIARLVGKKLGLRVASLDDVCYEIYAEIGWNGKEAGRIYQEEGGTSFVKYTQTFEPYGVEQILARNPGCIIDMGGHHTVTEDPVDFARIREALAPYRNVVLLLPSPDSEESIRILKTRRRPDLAEYLVRTPCYHALAKHIVYAEAKSLDEIRDEVILRSGFGIPRREGE